MSVGWLKTKTYWGKVDGKCGQTCGDEEIVTMRGEHTMKKYLCLTVKTYC